MNKKLVLALALLLLLGGGTFAVKSMKGTSSLSSAGQVATKGSIAALLGSGKNVSCTMTLPDGSKGTVYVSGENVRGEFMTKGPDGRDIATSYIVDKDYMYMWSGKQGTKFKNEKITPAPDSDTSTSSTGENAGQGPNLDEEGELDCKRWRVDKSMFTPPSDVQFADFTAMMEKTKTDGEKMVQDAGVNASVCEQITDASAKAACQSSLGGN